MNRKLSAWIWWGLKVELIVTLSWLVFLWPYQVFALSTGYSRVVAEAELIAFQAAKRSSMISAVATAAAATTPVSTALRFVAGPVGWAALAVSAGALLYQAYYSGSDLAAIKEAARPAGSWNVTTSGFATLNQGDLSNYGGQPVVMGTIANGLKPTQCAGSGYDFGFYYNGDWAPSGAMESYWARGGAGGGVFYACHINGQPGTLNTSAGADPSSTQIGSYLTGLSSGDPLSIESHSEKAGVGSSPTPAEAVSTVPVSTSEMETEVKANSAVAPGDMVVAVNVNPEPGTETETEQTTTTDTTTTTDGDTKTEESTATVSCMYGEHDGRTMTTIFQSHKEQWETSGVFSMLTVLGALTWPSTLGSYSFDFSHMGFGTHTVDFNDYAGFFTILRSMFLLFATFLGYRIIFG